MKDYYYLRTQIRIKKRKRSAKGEKCVSQEKEKICHASRMDHCKNESAGTQS